MSTSPQEAAHQRQQALGAVLDLFQMQWPRTEALKVEHRKNALRIWNGALTHVPTDILVPAAERYLSRIGGKWAPDAPTFATFAGEIARRYTDAATPQGKGPLRKFWFAKPGERMAVAMELATGGWAGIAPDEFDKVQNNEIEWGWL